MTLGQELIVDANVAVGGSANRDTLLDILTLFVVVDFAGARPPENLQFQLYLIIVKVDVEVGRYVQLSLLGLSTELVAHVSLQVLVLRHEIPNHDINDDVCLAHIDQHVVFQRLHTQDISIKH